MSVGIGIDVGSTNGGNYKDRKLIAQLHKVEILT
jgi:hypothetical protein